MATPEEEIRRATERYYEAFNKALNGDPEPESRLWSHKPDVVLLTAGGDKAVGWEAVSALKDRIAKLPFKGEMSPRDLVISVIGDVAFTTCTEHGEFSAAGETRSGDHRVTHIYRREDGEWKLVLRHADVDVATEIVTRLEAA